MKWWAMARTHLHDQAGFDEIQRDTLLRVARDSIRYGLAQGGMLRVKPEEYPPALQASLACFVTLHTSGQLRGCIGHLEASQPLVQDVAENAYSAAFRDPRFPPLRAEELPELRVQVSVLTPAAPIQCASEEDLIAQLRPGVDGLILVDGSARGTFLPSVWESLPDPREFLRHLKIKAGLRPGHWSDRTKAYRYETESFGD